MSAVVCRKRSNSIFEELLHTPPPLSKRIRCSSPAVAARFSPSSAHAGSDSSYTANLIRLISLFPHMDQQILESELEASGNDLDSAIRSLNDLHLESAEINPRFDANKSGTGIGANVQPIEDSENQAGNFNPPTDGSKWVDMFVREMMNATNMDDARARASQLLEVLEKSIMEHGGANVTQSLHKENLMLKEQVQVLLQENSVLKRAVAIQHERQKEYDGIGQELHNLKQLASQYQEQLRTLEVNNYALTMHLRQAQQSSSIPGRFHPDIF